MKIELIDFTNTLDLREVEWNNLSSTSYGILPKALHKNKFFKLPVYNNDVGFYGSEPFYELLAFKVGELLGVNMSEIEVKKAKIIFERREFVTDVAISPDFSIKRSFYPIEKFINYSNLTAEDLFNVGKYREDLFKIFQFDFIINNIDRHGRNIELDMEGISPVFDNSLSFFSKVEDELLDNKLTEKSFAANNFIGKPNLKDNLVLCDKLYLNCNRLSDILLEVGEIFKSFTISEYRSKFIENMLIYRVKFLKNYYNNLLWS